MASASAGLELPATSLIAPLLVLGRIAVSWREAPLPRALITRRRQGWQYDGPPGSALSPWIQAHWGCEGWCPMVPSPACGGGTGRGHAKRTRGHAKNRERARSPPPPPSPACGGGSKPSLLLALTPRYRASAMALICRP